MAGLSPDLTYKSDVLIFREPGVAVPIATHGLGSSHEVGTIIIHRRTMDVGRREGRISSGPAGKGGEVRVRASVKFVQVFVTRDFPANTGGQDARTVRRTGRVLEQKGQLSNVRSLCKMFIKRKKVCESIFPSLFYFYFP